MRLMGTDAIILRCDKVQVDRRGAKFPANLTESEWKSFGLELARLQDDIHFALADWLNFGRQRYRAWRVCSEAEADRLAFAVAGTSFASETLRICAWVGRKIGARRNLALSWSHHKEVAQLPPKQQSKFLTLAEQNHWSVSELRLQRRLQLSKEAIENTCPQVPEDFPDWIWEARRWLNRQNFQQWTAARRAAWNEEVRPLMDALVASVES